MSTTTSPTTNTPDGSAITTPQLGDTYIQSGITINVVIVDIIITLVVVLRLVTRKFIVKSLGWDDWTILAAAIGNNLGFALVLVEVHFGFGRHRSDLTSYSYVEYAMFTWIEWIQTFQTLMLTKISICLLLLRIVISPAFVYSLWTLIAALISSNLILTLLWIFQCRPVYLAWYSPMEAGSCLNMFELRNIIFAQAIVSVASDFILAAYPIFIIRRLKMPVRTKVGLCILMGLGVLTGSFCIARTVLNWQNVTEDVTWDSITNWYLRSWEICVGIVVACIPALRPGYKNLHNRWRGYTSNPSEKSKISGTTLGLSGPSQHSRPSDASRQLSHPQYIPTIESMQQKEPFAPMQPLPENSVRPDLQTVRATAGTEFSNDSLRLPIQRTSEVGIAQQVLGDLESQRGIVDSEFDDAGHEPKTSGWESQDSETALRGNEGLVKDSRTSWN